MDDKKCPNNAEVIVPWAGKILKGCKKHANAMAILGNVMGAPVEARALPPKSDKCEFQDDLENS